MKIVHLCLASFFPDGYQYQENLLPKFHKQLGFEVEVIASLLTFDENGKTTYMPCKEPYYNEYNIRVVRLEYRSPKLIYRKMRKYKGLAKALKESNPDVLFIHGCQFLDIKTVCNYLKKIKNVLVYVDNHADCYNSATNWLSRNVLHKIIWKKMANMIEPLTKKFYGVLPNRVTFLEEYYNLPSNKCELLVMGADDLLVKNANNKYVKSQIRLKYGIKPDDFLIVTGGKFDNSKKQILNLLVAVSQIKNERIKLIFFGSVIPEMKNEIEKLIDGIKTQYVGWIESSKTYEFFSAADLVVFPGTHSVLWEEVVGIGKPMVCKYFEGINHIDLGGNIKYLYNDSNDELKDIIECILNTPGEYEFMCSKAVSEEKEQFLYHNIAKKSLEII